MVGANGNGISDAILQLFLFEDNELVTLLVIPPALIEGQSFDSKLLPSGFRNHDATEEAHYNKTEKIQIGLERWKHNLCRIFAIHSTRYVGTRGHTHISYSEFCQNFPLMHS